MIAFEQGGRLLSFVLIFLSGISFTIGLSFFATQKDTGWIRIHILTLGIASCIWCLFYGMIGFTTSEELFHIFRCIGLLGIDLFLVTDFFVVSEMSGIRKKIQHPLNTVVACAFIVDWFLFSDKKVDTVVFLDNYTTWYGNPSPSRTYHMMLMAIIFVVMGTIGALIIKSRIYKRQKQFILVFYVANVMMAMGSLPDTYITVNNTYAIPASALGSFLNLLILWMGAMQYNAFDISIGNLIDNIYNFVNIGILAFDINHKLFLINPYGQELTGAASGKKMSLSDIFDLNGLNEEDFFSYSKDDNIVRVKTIDGKRVCSVRTSTAIDKYGEPYCYLMAVSDITSEERVMDELRMANAAKSIFLSSMSHEIRTPINAILGMNEMILRESHENAISEYANYVQNSGKLLLSLINDILDFSKIDSGKMELIPVNYELATVVNDVKNIITHRVKEKDLTLKIIVNPNLPTVLLGDETRIKQIAINLLTNAVKYTDEGLVTFKIDYESIADDQIQLIITTKDTGRGIKKDSLKKLFKSFERVDENANRNIEGTGLGLSITKGITDLMHGSIEVESVYRAGSRFTIRIPQKVIDNTPIGDINTYLHENTSQTYRYEELFKAPNVKILVVDDVEMNCKMVSHLLKRTEITVDIALSGQEAIRKSLKEKYHMILMDHMMPGMDGFECLNRIRQDDNNPNKDVPVLALTANVVAGARDSYVRAGFNEYLTKPIEGVKLEEAIKEFIPKELILKS